MAKKKDELFYRVQLSAYESGLMAALGPHRWFLLCALATYMDENGIAYPKQDDLAEKLNSKHRCYKGMG